MTSPITHAKVRRSDGMTFRWEAQLQRADGTEVLRWAFAATRRGAIRSARRMAAKLNKPQSPEVEVVELRKVAPR